MLAGIALLGLFQLWFPFSGDQALFTVGGRQLLDGSVLYRDFWDVKQPGIYVFFAASGALFGFDEAGIHLGELLWNLAYAVAIQRALRVRTRSVHVAAMAPLLIVGVYYAAEGVLDMTQVEALVGFPLFVTMWACLGTRGPRFLRLFLAGLATGGVVAFKLVYLPLAGVFWLFPAWEAVRGARPVREVLATVAPLMLGLAVPVGAMVVYFAWHGLLDVVGFTWFVYPMSTPAIEGRPWSRLLLLPPHVRDVLGLSGVLALVALVLRREQDLGRWTWACLAWLGAGIPLFAIQHWWTYHVPLFMPPLALLAAGGLDVALQRKSTPRGVMTWVVAGVVALAAVFPLRFLAAKGYRAAMTGFGLTEDGRVALQDRMQPYYVSGRLWAKALTAPGALPGPVYVIGNPIALYLTGRDQAIPLNGWAVDQFDTGMWERMAVQLEVARPPYLAVRHLSGAVMRERSRAMVDLIRRQYCVSGGSPEDTWYRLRGPEGCTGNPDALLTRSGRSP